jgi:hypothetical protein
MNCRVQIAGAVAAVCLLWPAAANAQLAAPREAAQIQYGPVSLYPSLQVVDAGKDSNVFDDNESPKSDYTFTLASRALVVTRLGANELMFSTGSDYVWFRQYTQERSANAVYSARINLSAGRLKPFIGAERIRTRARPTAEIDARARRLQRYVVVGSNFDLTERTALTASASVSDSAYEKGETFRGVNLKDSLDRQERSYSAGVRYALTPLTMMELVGTYGSAIFPDHLRDAKSYTFAPVFEFSPDAGIRGRAMAGVQRFTPNDPEFKPFTGLTFLTGVNWTLWGRTGFDVQAQRNISYSYKDTEPYYLLTSGRLGISQKLFGPIDLSGAAERQFVSYRFRRGAVPGVGFQPDQTARDIVTAGVGVSLGRGFRVVISGERTVRKSPIDTQANFVRTRLLSTVTIGS